MPSNENRIPMLVLNGILTLSVLLISLVRFRNHPEWIIFQGIVLISWIGFELILMSEFNAVEIVLLLGISGVLVSGIFLGKRKAGE